MIGLEQVHDLLLDCPVQTQFVVDDVGRELSLHCLQSDVVHQGRLKVLLAKWLPYVQAVHGQRLQALIRCQRVNQVYQTAIVLYLFVSRYVQRLDPLVLGHCNPEFFETSIQQTTFDKLKHFESVVPWQELSQVSDTLVCDLVLTQ